MNRTLAIAWIVLFAACGGDDSEADASLPPDAPPPRGTISMTWRVESGGAQVACEDVGADLVALDLIRQGDVIGEADSFTCAAAEASTREVVTGTYNLRLDLLDGGGQSLLDEQVSVTGIEVGEDSDTPIGEIVFDVPAAK